MQVTRKLLLPLIFGVVSAWAQTPTGNGTEVGFKSQTFNRPENCLPCHQRQFDELASSVKSGYRNVSPFFNGLETAGNFINGGLLRPVYHESAVVLPDGVNLNTNMFTTPVLTEIRQLQAGSASRATTPTSSGSAMDKPSIVRSRSFPGWGQASVLICSALCATTTWWIPAGTRFCPQYRAVLRLPVHCRPSALPALPATSATTRVDPI